jgi:hypothetical protein
MKKRKGINKMKEKMRHRIKDKNNGKKILNIETHTFY